MNHLSLLTEPIAAELEDFRRFFDASLSSDNPLLNVAIAHIKKQSGKMMRPILVLLAARGFSKVYPATLHAAVSFELLHTASLVHDDVVDESNERRGQQSLHTVYGNKEAVLVGDFLLATSLVEVAKTGNRRIVEIVASLGRDLAEGELLQLSNIDNPDFSESIYFDIIRKKTAVLFAACMQAGGLSAGAPEEAVERMRLFGEYVGLCFQIRDDIFDYFGSKEIGKPTSNDMLEGKLTLPALYALNSTHDKAAEEIAAKVKKGKATSDEIARLIEFTKQNGGIEYATEVMRTYKERALLQLAYSPNTAIRSAFTAYLDYVVERER